MAISFGLVDTLNAVIEHPDCFHTINLLLSG